MSKKLMMIFFAFMSFLFFNGKVYALDMKINEVKLIEKSEDAIANDFSYNDKNEIDSNIAFNKLNDYIILNVKIKNNEKYNYSIEEIKNNLDIDNISIENKTDTLKINGNSTFNLRLKIKYDKELDELDEKTIHDLLITIVLIKEDGSKEEIVIVNPITGDHLYKYLILLIIGIIGLFLINKIIKRKELKYLILFIILLLVTTPLLILAYEKYEVNILLNSITINNKIIDNDAPDDLSISSSNNLSETQTVVLKCNDNIGVTGYYFGLDRPNENTEFTDLTSTTNMEAAVVIGTEGKYYFVCMDKNKNKSEVIDKDFYKTSLIIDKGTVTPNKILTMV